MIVLITGSREYSNRTELTMILDRIYRRHGQIGIVVGDCPTGADLFAREWVWDKWRRDLPNVFMREFEANWEKPCRTTCYHPAKFKNVNGVLIRYCPQAGMDRNTEMVEFMVMLREKYPLVRCFAFYRRKAKNRGTRDCHTKALAAGIKCVKVMQEM